ncbi:SDR family NAD(P)-dependent oxidoreductase [Agarivorans sp. DSG3-1]|uniref:SDR family NAD(P)-dependent oxidoreductase n=1 Tax=Agarivorans sp. DSG3-1 TaxID=3342249 RepID=UPI00398E60F8
MQKTILITGSTDGIGFETAKMLLAQGHQVLLHGRNATKLQQVEENLAASVECAKVQGYVADLSNLPAVKQLAEAISHDHSKLDVLINNAGVFNVPNAMTQEGLDLRFVVNTFAPYLLTTLLLPLMNASGRVVNLSSAAQATVNLNALAGEGKLSDGEAYAQSKLALTMWSRLMGLAQKSQGPMVVSVNPKSLLGSKMVKDAYGIAGGSLSIGADILCRAALSEEFNHAHGLYFDNDLGQFASPHSDALNEQKSEAVLAAIEAQIVKLV